MADKISFEAPRGMRDFYPADMAWRNRVFGAFRAAADAAGGFVQVEEEEGNF